MILKIFGGMIVLGEFPPNVHEQMEARGHGHLRKRCGRTGCHSTRSLRASRSQFSHFVYEGHLAGTFITQGRPISFGEGSLDSGVLASARAIKS
jgi:hypothetical protein